MVAGAAHGPTVLIAQTLSVAHLEDGVLSEFAMCCLAGVTSPASTLSCFGIATEALSLERLAK